MGWLRHVVQHTAALKQREHARVGAERSKGGQRQGLAWRRRRNGFSSYIGVGVVRWTRRMLDVATRLAGMRQCIAPTWLGARAR
jgi:hypothetical protein